MPKSFRDAYRRVERARRKIAEIDRLSKPLLGQEAFEVAQEMRWIGPQNVMTAFVRAKEAFPDEIGDLGDSAIDNLRAALDSACHDSAEVGGVHEPKSAYFPFADTPDQLENVIKGRCRDLHPDIQELAKTFQPYKGGHRLLWAFNKARQSNQHKNLINLSLSTSALHLGETVVSGSGEIPIPRWDHEKHECVLAYVHDGGSFKMKGGNLEFYLGFIDAGDLTGQPVIAALNRFASEVERIVMAIEAETARLFRP